MAKVNKKARAAAATQPLQWETLQPEERKLASKKMAAAGTNRRANAQARITTLKEQEADPGKPASRREAAAKERSTLEEVAPHLNDRSVSLESAAGHRARAFSEAADTARDTGAGAPAGTGWYFDHHRQVAKVAKEQGYDPVEAVHAAGLMSPQNSPQNERKAVGGLMKSLRGGIVDMTPELHDELKAATIGRNTAVQVNEEHRGKRVPMSELHPTAIAALSESGRRKKVRTEGADLDAIALGGTKGNIANAVGRLRGQDVDMDPIGGPKVWSYTRAGRNAVPDTAVEHEYHNRVSHAADQLNGREVRGQTMLDHWGLRHSHEGILNPDGHTAEDTWQNAITHAQPHKSVGKGTTSVMKTAGSNASLSDIGDTPAQHAFNNKATRMAARKIERQAGLDYKLPAVAVQEVGWTHERRKAGKDPEYNAEQAAAARPPARAPRKHEQGTLF